MKKIIILVIIIFCVSGVLASSVSVWQGQYYTGTTFNTGTYIFNFTAYDALIGGNICFTNTTSLTTGNWGQWRTEQIPWGSCNDSSKDYFLNINIAGADQTSRRRLTVSDFSRRDVNETFEENVTADYYFGDGSLLTNINGSGDITSVQGDEIYLYNGSNSGDVVLVFNETKLNVTIDSKVSGIPLIKPINSSMVFAFPAQLDVYFSPFIVELSIVVSSGRNPFASRCLCSTKLLAF